MLLFDLNVDHSQAVASYAGVPVSAVSGLSASQGRRLLSGVNVIYLVSNVPTNRNGGAFSSVGSALSCFAGSELMTLETGVTKVMT